MKRTVCILVFLLFAHAGSFSQKYERRSDDASMLHRAQNALTKVIVHDIFSPPVASRIYLYANIAAYETLVASQNKYRSLSGSVKSFPVILSSSATNIDYHIAAVHAFFYTAGRFVFSEQVLLDSLKKIVQDTEPVKKAVLKRSAEFGRQIADSVIRWSLSDQYNETRKLRRYVLLKNDGKWLPTPPGYIAAIEPNWNMMRPVAVDSASVFRPVVSPVYSTDTDSDFYKQALEVYNSCTNLTTEQEAVASFWDCNPFYLNTQGHLNFATKKLSPGGHWMLIAGIASRAKELDMISTAAVYTMTAIALYDGFIVCWDEKYRSNLIRPETFINSFIDESWRPLLQTPPFPEYPSGHSVISTAAATVLTFLFGNHFEFEDTAEEEYGLGTRRFTSFMEAASEAAISRLYGGIHYRDAIEDGQVQGALTGAKVISAIRLLSPPAEAEQPPAPVLPIPDERQMKWHEMELNAFIHFTTNTFTGKEWGFGDESPRIFNPARMNPRQWTRALKKAGFKGVILTAKHHDGFCLWPSAYTDHSVKASPWKNGQGDVVKDVAEACRKEGLQFGIYLSPWDRNRKDYGQSTYIDYYRNQLRELFSNYGSVFEMWFDGANGGDGYYGGAREKRQIDGSTYYDWPTTLDIVRQVQPGVLFFSDAGPDLRWVGNERGIAGKTNWNTISNDTLYAGKPGIENLLNTGSPDGDKWIPAEVDVSIRPGWFYHREEDTLVKSAERLFEIYLTSVGRGSTLLLNIPPDKSGLFHENDLKSLEGFNRLLKQEFEKNLALKANITATAVRSGSDKYSADNLIDGDKDSYWATDDDTRTASVEVRLKTPQTIKYILLQEYIRLGQRVQSFSVDVWENNAWKKVASETTIGYKRIIRIDPVRTERVRVVIEDAKACPVLSNLELY